MLCASFKASAQNHIRTSSRMLIIIIIIRPSCGTPGTFASPMVSRSRSETISPQASRAQNQVREGHHEPPAADTGAGKVPTYQSDGLREQRRSRTSHMQGLPVDPMHGPLRPGARRVAAAGAQPCEGTSATFMGRSHSETGGRGGSPGGPSWGGPCQGSPSPRSPAGCPRSGRGGSAPGTSSEGEASDDKDEDVRQQADSGRVELSPGRDQPPVAGGRAGHHHGPPAGPVGPPGPVRFALATAAAACRDGPEESASGNLKDEGIYVGPLLRSRPWVSGRAYVEALKTLLGPESSNLDKEALERATETRQMNSKYCKRAPQHPQDQERASSTASAGSGASELHSIRRIRSELHSIRGPLGSVQASSTASAGSGASEQAATGEAMQVDSASSKASAGSGAKEALKMVLIGHTTKEEDHIISHYHIIIRRSHGFPRAALASVASRHGWLGRSVMAKAKAKPADPGPAPVTSPPRKALQRARGVLAKRLGRAQVRANSVANPQRQLEKARHSTPEASKPATTPAVAKRSRASSQPSTLRRKLEGELQEVSPQPLSLDAEVVGGDFDLDNLFGDGQGAEATGDGELGEEGPSTSSKTGVVAPADTASPDAAETSTRKRRRRRSAPAPELAGMEFRKVYTDEIAEKVPPRPPFSRKSVLVCMICLNNSKDSSDGHKL